MKRTIRVAGDLRLEAADDWLMILDSDGGDFPGVLVPLELVDRLIIALSEIRTPDLPQVRSLIGQARSETVRARVAQPDDGRLGRIAGLLEQVLQAVREPVDLAAIPSGLAVWRGDDD